jgi:hypothetical protein
MGCKNPHPGELCKGSFFLLMLAFLRLLLRFQYVACQLDELRELSAEGPIRKALGSLPVGLDATYDRALLRIHPEQRNRVANALMWLAFSVRPLTIDEFAEAFVLDRENMASLQKDRLFNAEDALQYLPSLIIKMPPTRKVKGPTVRFSHFSVKEYITSERLLQGKNAARSLYFSETDAHIHIAHTCAAIIFPSKEQREKLPTPLRPYAQSNFNSHVDKILDHPLTAASPWRRSYRRNYPGRLAWRRSCRRNYRLAWAGQCSPSSCS